MDSVAFVFSGQGAQYPGMGKELYEASAAAKQVFDLADQLRPGTTDQCFGGTAEELAQTINTQPCVYCVDLAAAESLREAGIRPAAVAGFSLGEVAALTFAGSFGAQEGFRLVCRRAEFMQDAAQKHSGAMAAVLKLAPDAVLTLCEEFGGAYPVNYNSPAQTVVALPKEKLAEFTKAVQASGGKAVPLAVSGGFHSPFMDEAAQRLAEELEHINMAAPAVLVYANSTALPYGENRKELLSGQVNHPVYWQKTIETTVSGGITAFVEVGPGKTLSGLIRKIAPTVRVLNVEDAASLNEAKEALL